MKKYTIITGTSIESLIDLVNETYTEGWRPLGAPFLATGKLGDQIYRQAIVQKDEIGKRRYKTFAEMRKDKERKHKSLAQIAYEADPRGGQQNFGPWETAYPLVKSIHENMVEAVKREILSRLEFWLNDQKMGDVES